MTHSLFRRVWAGLAGLVMLAVAQPAAAQTGMGVAVFYTTIRFSEAEALAATAAYYEAIGMSARAQRFTRLAADFRSGSLGGADGVKTFVQCSDAVGRDIQELQSAGIVPNARQAELAKAAKGKLTAAKISLVAAVALGTKTVLDAEGNMFAKMALGVMLGAEAARVVGAIRKVDEVADQYRAFQLGASNGFQTVSREAMPQFAAL
jgi:hypothetical protein